MTAITSVTGQQLFRPVENKPEMSSEDTKTARISHELMMLKTVHGGFISSDKKMQLLEMGASPKQLESIESNRFRLLGGDDHKNERRSGTQEILAEARRETEGKYLKTVQAFLERTGRFKILDIIVPETRPYSMLAYNFECEKGVSAIIGNFQGHHAVKVEKIANGVVTYIDPEQLIRQTADISYFKEFLKIIR